MRIPEMNGRKIPQWFARGLVVVVIALTTVVWGHLTLTIAAKADAKDVEDLQCDVDRLVRKAEADQTNDVVTRRVLDDLARAASMQIGVNITPGGPLVEPRPADKKTE